MLTKQFGSNKKSTRLSQYTVWRKIIQESLVPAPRYFMIGSFIKALQSARKRSILPAVSWNFTLPWQVHTRLTYASWQISWMADISPSLSHLEYTSIQATVDLPSACVHWSLLWQFFRSHNSPSIKREPSSEKEKHFYHYMCESVYFCYIFARPLLRVHLPSAWNLFSINDPKPFQMVYFTIKPDRAYHKAVTPSCMYQCPKECIIYWMVVLSWGKTGW